jgi:hypothetical protein
MTIPGYDIRSFACVLAPHDLTATGTVTHVSREGWRDTSEQYVVETKVRARTYKFTILRIGDGDDAWGTSLVSIYDANQKLLGVNTFRYANAKIEFLFEEAMLNLVALGDETAEDN